ncbi:MAG: calcium-binding protein, partial [Pseudomonadota bacterium]
MPSTYRLEGLAFWNAGSSGIPIFDFDASIEVVAPTNRAEFSYTVVGEGTQTVNFFSGDFDLMTLEGGLLTVPGTVTVSFTNTAFARVVWAGGVTDVLVVSQPVGTSDNFFFFDVAGASLDPINTFDEGVSFLRSFLNAEFRIPNGDFIPDQPISFGDIPWDSITPVPKPEGIELTGDETADFLAGTDGDDRLDGREGDDTFRALDGNDTIIAGAGDDTVFGGSTQDDERDIVYGGAGHDSIDGGAGNDELWGQDGNDTIEGGFGVDTVLGGAGDDVLTGSAWSDVILGGAGGDFINGGFGFDRVNGGDG